MSERPPSPEPAYEDLRNEVFRAIYDGLWTSERCGDLEYNPWVAARISNEINEADSIQDAFGEALWRTGLTPVDVTGHFTIVLHVDGRVRSAEHPSERDAVAAFNDLHRRLLIGDEPPEPYI